MAGYGQFSKRWEDLEFSDNFIFCKVLEDTRLCKQFLEILLHIEIDHLEKPVAEKTNQATYKSKGVRFDVYVKDSNRIFDIEMQTGNYKDLLLRARYYQSNMDLSETPRRISYCDLKETYIIFICKEDPFHKNMPVYIRDMCFRNCQDFVYNDKSHFIVYNASAYEKESDKEVRAVLKFISKAQAETSFTNELDSTVSQMKNLSEMEDDYMYFMDYVEEEKADAREEATLNTKISNAINMLKLKKLSHEEISSCTGLPLEKINELAQEILVSAKL